MLLASGVTGAGIRWIGELLSFCFLSPVRVLVLSLPSGVFLRELLDAKRACGRAPAENLAEAGRWSWSDPFYRTCNIPASYFSFYSSQQWAEKEYFRLRFLLSIQRGNSGRLSVVPDTPVLKHRTVKLG